MNPEFTVGHECPYCGTVNMPHSPEWNSVGYMPIECEDCHQFYWCKLLESETLVKPGKSHRTVIPEMKEGTEVYLINREHPRHLEPGIIEDRDHLHYRVKFQDGVLIWCPHHWIFKSPEEEDEDCGSGCRDDGA